MNTDLTTTESAERAEIDATLAETRVATSRHIDALFRCHEKSLWRSTHKSFKDYCHDHSALKERAIYTALKAQSIRHQLADCKGSAVVSDNTALTLDKMKPAKRKSVFHRAQKITPPNHPITPHALAQVAKPSDYRDYSNAYSSPTKPVETTHATPPPPPDPTLAPPHPLSQEHATLFRYWLASYYDTHKSWFNDLSQGRPRTPREIIDHIINATTAAQEL